MRRRQQLLQFDERRSRAAADFCSAAKSPRLILKTQCADAAGIVHCQQEIDRLELNNLLFLAGPASCLAALGMVAHDDPPGPTIRLRIGKCPMKNRAVCDFPMILWTCHQRKRRLKSKAVF